MEACKDCGKFDFIEICGDCTCQNCGLVKYTHAIDDSVQWNQFESGEPLYEKPTKSMVYFKRLLTYMQVDSILEEMSIEWYSLVSMTGFRKKQALMALSTYCASLYLKRGITIETVQHVFKISKTQMWVLFKDTSVKEIWSKQRWYKQLLICVSNRTDRLSRTIYELDCIPYDHIHKVIKHSKSLYEKVHSYPQVSSLKSYTLQATCIYIACKILDIKISKKVLCESLNVCCVTISKNEKLIQKALVKHAF
jgi:transcription initiation factor TFIIIB Brf1 subunit/transcription initiation factor TFIIB